MVFAVLASLMRRSVDLKSLLGAVIAVLAENTKNGSPRG